MASQKKPKNSVRSTSARNTRWIGKVAVVILGLLMMGVVVYALNLTVTNFPVRPPARATFGPTPTLLPVPTPAKIFEQAESQKVYEEVYWRIVRTSQRGDTPLFVQKELAKLREAIVYGKELQWEFCPDIRSVVQINTRSNRGADDGYIFGIEVRYDYLPEKNRLAMLNLFVVDLKNWRKVDDELFWSGASHEVLHIHQQCKRYQTILDEGITDEARIGQIYSDRTAKAKVHDEAIAYAMQIFWILQGYGPRSSILEDETFPALKNQNMVEVFKETFPNWQKVEVDSDGFPIGLEKHPNWKQWEQNIVTMGKG